ncbi:MAG: isochorismatase family protein [Pseudomonadota bacterium]
MAGYFTNFCVETTTRMAGNMGFDCYLLHDACATANRIDLTAWIATRYWCTTWPSPRCTANSAPPSRPRIPPPYSRQAPLTLPVSKATNNPQILVSEPPSLELKGTGGGGRVQLKCGGSLQVETVFLLDAAAPACHARDQSWAALRPWFW